MLVRRDEVTSALDADTEAKVMQALDRSIDTQVSRLRKKLELDPGDPQIIKTVWGGQTSR